MDNPQPERRMHYFDAPDLAKNDPVLKAAIYQGYVPQGCLLVGQLVLFLTSTPPGDACKGCEGDRLICGGRPK